MHVTNSVQKGHTLNNKMFKMYHNSYFNKHIYSTITNFSTKLLIICKVYTGVGGIKYIYHGLSSCTGDNPLVKARGSSPRTGVTIT